MRFSDRCPSDRGDERLNPDERILHDPWMPPRRTPGQNPASVAPLVAFEMATKRQVFEVKPGFLPD